MVDFNSLKRKSIAELSSMLKGISDLPEGTKSAALKKLDVGIYNENGDLVGEKFFDDEYECK